MASRLIKKQAALLVQQLADDRIGLFEKQSGNRSDLLFETAVEPNPMHYRQPFSLPECKIIDPIGGCGVQDPGAIISTDEIRTDHTKTIAEFNFQIVEQSLIALSNQLAALDRFDHFTGLVVFCKVVCDPGTGQNQDLGIMAHIGVVNISTDCE